MKISNVLFVLVTYLATVSSSLADQVIFQPGSAKGEDMWISSVYNRTSVDDEKLLVGGWGDAYLSFIKFDLSGLPQNATQATMWLYSATQGDSSTPVSMNLYLLVSPWDEQVSEYSDPLSGYYLGVAPAPPREAWYVLNISSLYNGWKNGTYANEGFLFWPTATNNKFNLFRSSDYSDPKYRPKLVVTYNGLNLGFPLDCSTPNCSGSGNIAYSDGPYTAKGITSVVDHKMEAVYS